MVDFEIVIYDFADIYDIFLETFDRRIRNSIIKNITRVKDPCWDVRYGGSISYIFIYPRGNDLICWVRNAGSKTEIEVRSAVVDVQTEIYLYDLNKPETEINEGKNRIVDCPKCGTPLSRDANFCLYCGLDLKKCMVCNLIIGRGEEVVKCPNCSELAHRAHLLEYLKIKAQCPLCGKPLNKNKII